MGTTQVLEVTATRWAATRAKATAWQLTDHGWVAVARMAARLGARGLVPAALRRQNSRTTPAGNFALGLGFGRAKAPRGTRIPYRVLTPADYWVYDPRDPKTYNRWVTGRNAARWRRSWAEHLSSYRTQYRYAVVIDYNHAASAGTPSTRAGGGIFLHVNGPGATAGCVSVARSRMVELLRWLDPAANPRIVVSVS